MCVCECACDSGRASGKFNKNKLIALKDLCAVQKGKQQLGDVRVFVRVDVCVCFFICCFMLSAA